MPPYVLLLNWTEQGVKNFKDTVDRYESARSSFDGRGVSFKDVYWTLGQHDIVGVVEAPDDATVAAAGLALAAQGNLRVTTMRAFSGDEMRGVIAKAG
jgi:uncharacterized protein with GYD domain